MTAGGASVVPRILLIEDDPSIASGIVRGLKAAGFAIELANDGKRGAELALTQPFDLIVLDLMLPELDGFEALELWRTRMSVPVIVLTALTTLDARLRVFSGGAVDYMAKPFWIEELIARVRTRLHIAQATPARRVAWDDAVLDLDARAVTVQGKPVAFTATEINILSFLVERAGRAISREQLAEAALPSEGDRFDRTIDSHVARIRRKLGPAAAARIATVWGIGYRFDPP